jgi:hypothetical protein
MGLITYNFEALQNTITTKMDSRNCIIEAETTINHIRHKVRNRFIVCDASLNRMAWGVTPTRSKCPICFNKENNNQLTLF